jgi:hypothetical protein
MRFKKLIAAGASFLLVMGASTLGAAAAYADDGTTAPDTVAADTATAPDPVVDPAPEPVAEPAPEPVVEPAPEPAPDPVVEPSDDPVPSDTPSTESDSDPPAQTSSESGSSSDSGTSTDVPVTRSAPTVSSFTRTTSTLKTGFLSDKPADAGPPVDNTNETTYWENLYPGTTCYKDDPTYGSLADSNKAVVLVNGTYVVLIVKSGAEDNGDGPGNAVYENPTPGTNYYGPLNGGGQQGTVSHWIVCLGEQEDVAVVPAAQGTDQTCDEEESELVGGSIQLTLITGVTYTITGPSPDVTVIVPDGTGLATGLAPGSYNVSFVLDPGYTTDVDSPIVITIGEFDGECGEVIDDCVTPVSLNTEEPECCDTVDTASLTTEDPECDPGCDTASTAGLNAANVPTDNCELPKVYLCHATQANPNANNPFNPLYLPVAGALGHAFPNPNDDHTGDIIPPFDYYENGVLKHFSGQNWPYGDPPSAEEWDEFLAFWDAGCVEPEEVTPAAQATDETCELLILTQGSVQVTVIAGVTYTVTGPNGVVPLDGSGNTGPVDPGQYSVAFTLDPGLTTSVNSPIIVTVNAFDGDCELVEHPIVTPNVISTALNCLDVGSYTLSNDLDDPNAVLWTVNGSPLGIPLASPSKFTVTSPGVYNIHADPNAPDYGFPGGALQDWTVTFVHPDDCDLSTLALTGKSPIAFLGGAMALILAGLAMFRVRAASQRKRMGTI